MKAETKMSLRQIQTAANLSEGKIEQMIRRDLTMTPAQVRRLEKLKAMQVKIGIFIADMEVQS